MNQLSVIARAARPVLHLLSLVVVASGAAQAAPLTLGGVTIGTLQTEGPIATSNAVTGGANFWANWDLLPGQTAVEESDLRWLQLAHFSVPIGGFPDRPFIDPRNGTNLGVVDADAEPWYDITGPSKAELSLSGGGDDQWIGDGPYAGWGFAPMTFSVSTLLVQVTDWDAKQARILGGLSWGYSLSTAGGNQVSLLPLAELANTVGVRDAFNTQLAVDFPGWSLIVPEPTGAILAATALWGFAVAVRRRGRGA